MLQPFSPSDHVEFIYYLFLALKLIICTFFHFFFFFFWIWAFVLTHVSGLEKILLGSKELGTNVLELHFVMLANHDQNVLVLF